MGRLQNTVLRPETEIHIDGRPRGATFRCLFSTPTLTEMDDGSPLPPSAQNRNQDVQDMSPAGRNQAVEPRYGVPAPPPGPESRGFIAERTAAYRLPSFPTILARQPLIFTFVQEVCVCQHLSAC